MNCTSTVYENRLRHRIIMLEDSLAKISSTRKELRDHVDTVKNEIRDTFGQHLSRLRNREQQILEKLDTVASVKDNILSQQQDRLHQALGSCTQGLQWLQIAYEDVKNDKLLSVDNAERRICEILNKYNSVDFTPRETSFVAFECDMSSLRQAILAFGQIRSAGIVRNSESMPCAMEDYEDEHLGHALSHKSVTGGAETLNINVGRTLLPSNCKREWLLKEALTGSAMLGDRGGQQSQQRDALSCSSVDDACSIKSHRTTQIHSWLHQIKNSVEIEPTIFDHFEISKKCVNVNAIETMDSASKEALFRKYFEKIVLSPDSDWLFEKQDDEKAETKEAAKSNMAPLKPTQRDFVQREVSVDDVISCTNSSFTTRPNNFQHSNSIVSSVEMLQHEDENLMFNKYAEYWHQFLEKLWSSSDSLWLLPCASGDEPVMVPHPDYYTQSTDSLGCMDDDVTLNTDKNVSLPKNFVPRTSGQRISDETRLLADLDINKSCAAAVNRGGDAWLLKSAEESGRNYVTCFTKSTNDADWLSTATNRGGAAIVSQDPPPSNETTPAADAYDDALGWRAVLEKVHGLGDEKWLLQAEIDKYGRDRGSANERDSVASVLKSVTDDNMLFYGYALPDMCPF